MGAESMFEFYWYDLVDNAPFLFQALVKMCAAGLATSAMIVLIDHFGWPAWFAATKKENKNE